MDFNLLQDGTREIIVAGTESGLFEFKLCGTNGLCLVADDKYLNVYSQFKVNNVYRIIHQFLLNEKLESTCDNIHIDI